MPSAKDLAIKANDAAFESAMQKIVVTFQTNLINANNDGAKQAAADAATKGIKVYTEIHDKMLQVISGVFP
jgi:hypothetical protein